MNMRLINILPALMLALPAFAVRIEQSLIEINAHGYNAPVRITPTNSAYAPADLSAPIVTGPTRIYTPVAGVLTISNLVEGAYTFEQAGKRLTFTVTNSLPTITNSIRELVSAGLVYGVNGPGFPGVVKATPTDTTPLVLGAKLVAGDNITITTNNASGNATLTITGAAAGGSGDDLLAGTNIWTGTNIFNAEIQGLAFEISTNGYGSFIGGLEAPTIYAPIYLNTPIVTNAENGSVVVEGVTFNDGGMDASNILTGTIGAARLPATWTNETGLFGNGSETVPSIGFASENDGSGTGFYRSSASRLMMSANGVNQWVAMPDIFCMKNSLRLGWSANSFPNNNPETYFYRSAANTIGLNGNFVPLSVIVSNGVTISSNSWTTPPTLSPGDISFRSDAGVPMVVSKDAGGVERTNRLDLIANYYTTNSLAPVPLTVDTTYFTTNSHVLSMNSNAWWQATNVSAVAIPVGTNQIVISGAGSANANGTYYWDYNGITGFDTAYTNENGLMWIIDYAPSLEDGLGPMWTLWDTNLSLYYQTEDITTNWTAETYPRTGSAGLGQSPEPTGEWQTNFINAVNLGKPLIGDGRWLTNLPPSALTPQLSSVITLYTQTEDGAGVVTNTITITNGVISSWAQ